MTSGSPPSSGKPTISTTSRSLVVDHPSGTEVFVDERFAPQPPPLAVHADRARCIPWPPPGMIKGATCSKTWSLATAATWTDSGVDSTRGSRATTGWRSSSAKTSRATGRSFWWRTGWIHPTDSSINVAIGQGRAAKPQGLVLEVPSPDGGWTVARSDLGFPAGKNKTILIDLSGILPETGTRRIRLRTNLEIFWDSLAVAEAAPADADQDAAARPAIGRAAFPRLLEADPGRHQLARAAGLCIPSPARPSAGAT